jgi:hypothetical protein
VIRRDYELAAMNEMRGVSKQNSALVQGLAHKRDVALGQVAHASVDELGAPARGSVSEVERLEQQRSISACGRIDG